VDISPILDVLFVPEIGNHIPFGDSEYLLGTADSRFGIARYESKIGPEFLVGVRGKMRPLCPMRQLKQLDSGRNSGSAG
jgi:hypothetical protein